MGMDGIYYFPPLFFSIGHKAVSRFKTISRLYIAG